MLFNRLSKIDGTQSDMIQFEVKHQLFYEYYDDDVDYLDGDDDDDDKDEFFYNSI